MSAASTLGRQVVNTTAAATAAVVASPGLYLGALTAAAFRKHRCGRSTSHRFAIVVPAHDEGPGIESTLASLKNIDYPEGRADIFVIADNCSDDTAARASACGVTVLERTDVDNRGKGYALNWAFGEICAADTHDAFVVIDADTIVHPDLLQRASHHLDEGAGALQVDYRVRNPESSWRTRLVDVGFSCHHRVRGRGRTALGLSVGLRGNGMVFSRTAITTVPYTAYSVVEDVEYGLMLGRAGIGIAGCDSTFVAGDMPHAADESESQRIRWELGRSTMRQQHGWPLVRSGLRQRDPRQTDLGIDLLLPPLATVGTTLVAATVLTAFAGSRCGPAPRRFLAAGWLGVVAHIGVGVGFSQSSWRAIPAMARIPSYVIWKASVRLSAAWRQQARTGATWTRTTRNDTDTAARTQRAVVA